MSRTSRIAGVRLPGRSALLFCQASDERLEPGEWVAVTTEWGVEAGCVAITPERVALAPQSDNWPLIERPLSPDEAEQAIDLAERALAQMDEVLAVANASGVSAELTGLRFILDGSVAIGSLVVDDEEDIEQVRSELAGRLGVRVEFETEPPGGNIFGSLGRLRPRYDGLDEIVRARFDLPAGEDFASPEGLPRLGSQVSTPLGTGRLTSISLRRQEATLLRDDGTETTVALTDLTLKSE